MPTFRHTNVARQELGAVGQRGLLAGRGSGLRRLARALVLLPGVAVIAGDLALQGGAPFRAGWRASLAYVVAASLGVALWTALIVAATARRGLPRWVARLALVGLAVGAVGGQLYAFSRYRAFLSTGSMLVGTAMLPSIRQELWFDHASLLRAIVPPVAAVFLVAYAQRRLAPPRRASRRAAIDIAATLTCVIALYAPTVSGKEFAPFDMLYLRGLGQLARAHWDHNPILARAHPGARSPRPVGALTPAPPRRRNVLLVLTESVRAASVCVDYDPTCATTPFSNEAARARLPLTQMRSVDSTTAISLGVLWTGVAPNLTRRELHEAPLVWEYAKAAGLDTAYWTSQNLLFGNSGTWLEGVPWGHFVSATGLDAHASLETGADDGALVDEVDAELDSLREPFFGVVHLANTHMPYAIDEGDAPFLPEAPETGEGRVEQVANRYADAIYHQDRAVGRLLEKLRERSIGARTIVVFLSDHGEQLYEKGGFGHTGTLFEPELHIPAWVDAPPGTLSPDEERSLRDLHDAPVTTMDVLPTLLDLMGVLDDRAVEPFVASFPGRSLLRGGSSRDTSFVLTNCSELWACAFKNWGAIAGTRKLVATEANRAWSCFDLASDPLELNDLGAAACGDLQRVAEGAMHGRPF